MELVLAAALLSALIWVALPRRRQRLATIRAASRRPVSRAQQNSRGKA